MAASPVLMSLLLLLRVVVVVVSPSTSISNHAGVEADDEATLLSFKAAAVRGSNGHALASWNGSSNGGFCSWEGVTCRRRGRRRPVVVALCLPFRGLTGVLSPSIGNLSFLRTMDLTSNRLSGDIPASLGHLQRLQVLNLSNNGFSGDIPTSIGHLRCLQALNLSDNAFSGELPTNLTSCSSLTILELHSNQLWGHIPTELGDKLTRLELLHLWGNNLTGAIPASLANLSLLISLDLSLNQLDGTIPPSLGHIMGLKFLTLAFNHLSGEPPRSLYNLSSLERLQIQENMLHGGIRSDIGSWFPNITILSFSDNQFTGSIPASLSNLTNLQLLDLSTNRLHGHVPPALGRLQPLQFLYLYKNNLEADDTQGWEFIASLSNCSKIQQLILGRNAGFTGHLPISIVNLSMTLQHLLLDDTGISGSIPSAIANLANLEYLNVATTSISGVIPDSIGKLEKLVWLGLYNTHLSGLIPSSIGNLTRLTVLYAYNGSLDGAIPPSLGKLKNLEALDLSMNHLNGSIPREIFKLPLLSDFLNLSYNSLSGRLPSEVGSLMNLNRLNLSGNQLSGEIPDSIGDCTVLEWLMLDNNSFEGSIPQSLHNIKGLNALNLSMNRLSGTLPDGIGSIHNLQQLDLAHNNLTGTIPMTLQNLASLSKLDLSFNHLQGEVPKEGIFRNLTYLSITGNNELCGGIPQLHLAPCHTNSAKRNRIGCLEYLKIALVSIGALLVLSFFITFFQFFYKKLNNWKQNNTILQLVNEDQYERVSYQTLEKGTDGFSETNLIGEGSFGMVYKCNFKDEGIIAAVKVFNLKQSGSTRSFLDECETLRRVRHRCLIKIITCCSSINNQGQEFKALVFEFMQNGSLNAWLHPESGMLTQTNTLSLEKRLDIAVDVMDALDYLHNHCQPSIIHCDLKPSNILLAEDMGARVGDFGISRILPESASKTLQNLNSTNGIRGSVGYIAPEYGEGSRVSTLGDVYSLGILLLEMFTGRSPTDEMFSGTSDLHKFSENALPERICEIVDPAIWMHTYTYNSSARSGILKCLVSAIALGISCSKKQPRERRPIQDAVIEMHAIRDSYLRFARSLVAEHEEVA